MKTIEAKDLATYLSPLLKHKERPGFRNTAIILKQEGVKIVIVAPGNHARFSSPYYWYDLFHMDGCG